MNLGKKNWELCCSSSWDELVVRPELPPLRSSTRRRQQGGKTKHLPVQFPWPHLTETATQSPSIAGLLYIWQQTQNTLSTELVDFFFGTKKMFGDCLGKPLNSNNIRVLLLVFGRTGCRRFPDATCGQRPRLSAWPMNRCRWASGQRGHPALHPGPLHYSHSVLTRQINTTCN